MSDYTTKQIGEAREKSLSPATKEIQGWLFSPQFLAILGIAQIAGAICTALSERRTLANLQKQLTNQQGHAIV